MTPEQYAIAQGMLVAKKAFSNLAKGERTVCVDKLAFDNANLILNGYGWKLVKTDIGTICNIIPLTEPDCKKML